MTYVPQPYETDEAYRWDQRPATSEALRIDEITGVALARSVMPGYENLAAVLQQSLDQAQHGKGKERHANSKPFDRQPIMEIGRMVGLGSPTGQAQKKTQEAVGMFNRGEPERAIAELLGAINYLAAAIMLIHEQ